MQKLLFFFLLNIFLATNTDAQNWFSADQRWVFNISGGFAGINQNFEMYAEADTVIQGHAARKWAFHSSGFFWLGPKFTYSDGPRAYYFAAGLDSFVKIYDFSLPVGAQVKIPNEFNDFTYQIDSIDIVQAGTLTLKRQRVHYLGENGQPTGWKFDILEDIGMVGSPFDENDPTCSFVLIPDYECGSVVDGFDIKFLCFSSPSGGFNPFLSTCAVVGTKEAEENSFQINPNPATTYFEIQTSSNSPVLISVTLTDVSGKKLRQWKGPLPQYSTHDLAAGIYFVEAVFEHGRHITKKLCKQ